MFNFENLVAWQKSVELADVVYSVTRTFPEAERFGLSSQMRRAAISVSSNIAEGTSRRSHDDQIRFIEIATGSLWEIVSQSHVAHRQGLLSKEALNRVRAQAEEQSRILSGLRRALKNS
jgi:four helix bundle protein